jgi:hypothetical protein
MDQSEVFEDIYLDCQTFLFETETGHRKCLNRNNLKDDFDRCNASLHQGIGMSL